MTEEIKTVFVDPVEIKRLDDLRDAAVNCADTEVKRRDAEVKRLDEKIRDGDVKYQIQFNAAKEALGIALIAQEKAVAAALDAAKEATGKAEIAMAKQFDLLSEKIDGVSETLNKNTGASGLYVTHSDLSIEMDKLRTSFESMLKPVVTFMDSQTGKAQGTATNWTQLGIIAGIVIALARLFGFI